jgi:hypothetical protein
MRVWGERTFLSAAEERLAWAPAPVHPLCSAGLDVAVEALVKLHALEARAPGSNQFLDSNYAQLEC